MGFRAWLLAAALLLVTAAAQPTGVLRIKITVVDAAGQIRPVPQHALLISANPTSAAPRRILTGADGAADVTLRAGNYTVESDQPLIFQGKAYEWNQTLDVAAGGATPLELTAANAQVEAVAARPAAGGEPSASGLLLDWQNSVVTIWTPTARGSGFLIDRRGLIATNQRLIRTDTSVEVQLSPADKVAGRVLVADAEKNVAIVWIDPAAVASIPPVTLGYAEQRQPVAENQKIFIINNPFGDRKSLSSATARRVVPTALLSDIHADDGDLGGPLFNAAGEVVAITTPKEETANLSSSDTLAVRIDVARSVIASAEAAMRSTAAPNPTRLPVESQREIPLDALKEAADARKGSFAPYRVAAADFDVRLITPVLVYGGRRHGERVDERGRAQPRTPREAIEREAARRALQDFGNWWDYVRDDPPVLMVRATPKMVESFWKSVLRGAASTQGVALPAIKHVKAGFSRLQLFCGEAEVPPIHPFKIEHRIGAADAVYEGLYVFDPAAIGPHCGTVTLTLFSAKAPDKGDTRVLDPKVLQQIWQDVALYR